MSLTTSTQRSVSSTNELSPQQTTQFLHSISTSLASIQSTASTIKSALKQLPDAEATSLWYRKHMAIRNYDARTETIVMSIWQIEPVAPGYLDYYTVLHVTDLIRKLARDCEALAAVAEERGVRAEKLRKLALSMEAEVGRLAGV